MLPFTTKFAPRFSLTMPLATVSVEMVVGADVLSESEAPAGLDRKRFDVGPGTVPEDQEDAVEKDPEDPPIHPTMP